jgi:hypothetical protein
MTSEKGKARLAERIPSLPSRSAAVPAAARPPARQRPQNYPGNIPSCLLRLRQPRSVQGATLDSRRDPFRLARTAATGLACVAWFVICLSASATNSVLPNGTNFVFWEQPLTFSKTYYVDNTSTNADDNGPGSSEKPFRTINKAAQVLQPGERVVIASGTYRECVRPARGGTGPTQMISYEAAPGAKVFIKGSDTLNDGWQPSSAASGRGAREGGTGPLYVWKHDLTGAMFPEAYNPFSLASVPGDWSWLDTKKVDMGPYFRRRGLVFVDGVPLEPMEQGRELGDTPLRSPVPTPPLTNQPASRNGLPVRVRGGAIMQEIGGSQEARFWVENTGNAVHVRVPAETPEKPLVEVTTREQAFVPLQPGLAYIRIKGLTFQHAGNGYPPPQRGLVSTAGGNHWIIEDNTIEWANGVGLDIGNGNWSGASAPQAGAYQIIRGNTIRYCGVEGMAGMGTQNTLVEDNLIEWCGWADAERAWEAAAAKFHGARNMLFRHNVIRHIRHANALWFDSNNSNCRITGNVMADVLTVSAAIHMEMNHTYNQIDNNVIWNVRNAEPGTPGQRGAAGSGIFIHATDCVIIAQNLIGLCDNAGVFPVLREDRAGSGTARELYIYNNIFTRCGKAGIVFLNHYNEANGNAYVSMPGNCFGFLTAQTNQWLDLPAWRESHGWDKESTVASLQVDFDPDRIELTMNSQEPLTKVKIFNQIDNDILGGVTGETRAPGPFSNPGTTNLWKVAPRATALKKTPSSD